MTDLGGVLLLIAVVFIAGAGGGIGGVFLAAFLVRGEVRRRIDALKFSYHPPGDAT